MKVRSLFTKAFWIGLALAIVAVLTVSRLSPVLAYSNKAFTVQPSTAAVTIASNDDRNLGGTLFKQLGGYKGIAGLVDYTLPRVVNDPLIGRYFVGLSTNSKQRVRQLLVDQICQATGGPCIYLGRSMALSHGGLGITNSEYDAFVAPIKEYLDNANVNQSAKDQVIAYVESFRGQIVER